MRKLIFAINTSLDGCCDHSKMSGSKEILDFYGALLRNADTLLYGRITYQLMVPYWPDVAKDKAGQKKEDYEFAQAFDSVSKIVVFSRTLDKAEGKNTRIVRSELRDEVLRLKEEAGRDILLGGVDLPSQLLQLGLVDEFILTVHPVIVGEGRRLFDGVPLQERLKLKLVESKVFESGLVALRYLKS